MIRIVGKALLWITAGLIGTVTIFALGIFVISQQVPVKLPFGGSVYINSWDQGYVSAQGTWIIEGTNQAFPVQFTKITCVKEDKSCTSAQAEISFGSMLNVDLTFYDVLQWDETTIIFNDTSPAMR
jgi:hypothetical protein